jgi:hypothetical protein
MTCPACQSAALNWRSGAVQADCRGCDVREVAQAPRHVREARYTAIRQNHGYGIALAFRNDVNAEFARIQRLKIEEQP